MTVHDGPREPFTLAPFTLAAAALSSRLEGHDERPPPSSTKRTPSSSRNPLTAGATRARPPTLCLPAPHTTRTALASVLAAPANTVRSVAIAPSTVRPCRSTVSGGRATPPSSARLCTRIAAAAARAFADSICAATAAARRERRRASAPSPRANAARESALMDARDRRSCSASLCIRPDALARADAAETPARSFGACRRRTSDKSSSTPCGWEWTSGRAARRSMSTRSDARRRIPRSARCAVPTETRRHLQLRHLHLRARHLRPRTARRVVRNTAVHGVNVASPRGGVRRVLAEEQNLGGSVRVPTALGERRRERVARRVRERPRQRVQLGMRGDVLRVDTGGVFRSATVRIATVRISSRFVGRQIGREIRRTDRATLRRVDARR